LPELKPIVWIAAGLVLAVLEMFVPGMVIIWFGIAAVVTGILAFLVKNPYVHFGVFIVLSGVMVFFSQWIGRKITKPEPEPVGANRMQGAVGTVQQEIRPGTPGRVKVIGEEWRAESEAQLPAGAKVRVVRVEGTRLIVEPLAEGSEK
jgi:membrane protein implicated in regulation of membrane protease activity